MEKPYIWITGASSGIGRALTIEFMKNDYNVFATSRRVESLKRLDAEIDSEGLLTFQSDTAKKEEVAAAYDFLRGKNGRIDCLINNAGITSFTLAEADSLELVESIIQTNLLGAIYTIKTVLPEMITRKDGWIISILSVAAKRTYTRSSAYAASKMGLQGYTDSMREEVRQHGIRVTNVFPGPTATPIWRSEVLEKNAARMMKAEHVAKLLVEMYKLKNTAVPEEIILRPISGEL